MSDETTNPTTPEQAAPEAPAAAPQAAAPAIYKVMVFDLHSGSLTEIPCASMGTAIDTYKRVNATARFERPFTVFDDLKWVAQHNYAGGKVRVVAISNGTKIFSRAAGVRNLQVRRAEEQSQQAAAPAPTTPVDVPALT
jgi:hypothetical protein